MTFNLTTWANIAESMNKKRNDLVYKKAVEVTNVRPDVYRNIPILITTVKSKPEVSFPSEGPPLTTTV